MRDPWDDLGPREFKTGFGVIFGGWVMGFLMTGAVGLGTVFLVKANEGVVSGWAHVVFGLALLAGGGVVAGLIESPKRRWLPVALGVTLGGILLPAVLALVFVLGPSVSVLGGTGLVASLAGTVLGGKLTAYARFREA